MTRGCSSGGLALFPPQPLHLPTKQHMQLPALTESGQLHAIRKGANLRHAVLHLALSI